MLNAELMIIQRRSDTNEELSCVRTWGICSIVLVPLILCFRLAVNAMPITCPYVSVLVFSLQPDVSHTAPRASEI